MPIYELKNDWVVQIPILTTNSAGVVEPMPDGDTFSATADNPASVNVSVGMMPDGTTPALNMNALVQVSPGRTVTVSDSAGLISEVLTVNIVNDVTPSNVLLDLGAAVVGTQPVPAAPGP